MLQKISMSLFACALLMFSSQIKVKAQTYKKLANGLEYYLVKDVPGNKKVEDGSFVSMNIKTSIGDSSMFDSYKMNEGKPIDQQLTGQFLGGFMEGFLLLSEGDSAILRMPIDSAFKGGQMPPFAKPGDKVIYNVKILSTKTQAEYEAEKKIAGAKQVSLDDKIIVDYLTKNKLKAEKTASGLYYIIEKKGNGKHATAADKVKVHYAGTLIDGTKFDSSYDRKEPIDFPLSGVIKGWTEGIPLLEEGGKGKLIIPSGLAYGANAPQGTPIKANEVLVFDVELLEILK